MPLFYWGPAGTTLKGRTTEVSEADTIPVVKEGIPSRLDNVESIQELQLRYPGLSRAYESGFGNPRGGAITGTGVPLPMGY